MMKALVPVFLVTLLLLPFLPTTSGAPVDSFSSLPTSVKISSRTPIANAVIVSDNNPFFGIIGSSAACWYNEEANTSGLLPLLIQHNGTLTDAQHRFLHAYFTPANRTLLILGEHLNTSYPTLELLGTPPTVALALATQLFTAASTVLILPYEIMDAYELCLLAAPLASYLNIPVFLYDHNDVQLQMVCTQLHTTHAYLVGGISPSLTNVTFIPLANETAITDTVLTTIKEEFGRIDYLTMTNPADAVPPAVINSTTQKFKDHITNKKIIILSKTIDLSGNDTRTFALSIPSGINRVQISGELLQKRIPLLERFSPIAPLLFLTLYDAQGHVVAYANSMSSDIGKAYLETLTCNASGTYTILVKTYFGIKGGYFIQRGLSLVDADVILSATISRLGVPHLPQIPSLSMLAPYLTAAHGGLILANASWELNDFSYASAAQGSGAGPWYTESLIPFTNQKVNATVGQLNRTLSVLDSHGLLSGYLEGPAWLAILADTTMIPMYYFGPSDADIPDRGLPSDNPYSLNESLSVGRLIGWDTQDVSVPIARTFFYEPLCGPSQNQSDWHHRFSFVFGQGFGETGGIFHQIPYARTVRTYGFNANVYGDLRDSRQLTSLLHVYTGANYIEYLGHGDWYWFPASVYGLSLYSKNVDVVHAKNWVYERPSVFLTSACLMGRTDGIPPQMNIGLAMLHAGCNAFIGSTRETGSEAGLTVLENHLIIDNWSIGEALRGEKQVDVVPPTFYVRVLYGDPAFNPYEPNNGFSDQGRPVLVP
jgi:hypothetical protein